MKKTKFISLVMSMTLMFSWCSAIPVHGQEKEEKIEVDVCAVGDNLIHQRVYKSGMNDDGTRDYTDMYRFYKEYLKDFDVCVVNQETVFVEDAKDFSGYPRFGGPTEIGLALMDAGFNMVTTATNHVMDKGYYGLDYSYKFWTDWGIEPVGTYTNKGVYDADTGDYTENRGSYMHVNGMTIGMLNYTYGTNGLPLPEDNEWMVGTLYDKNLIKREMEYMRKKCDCLIVFPHWGIEYQYQPSKEQEEWAQFFADNGADVIIGTHPHVIEPLEYIESDDGDLVPCYYSLGNFISNQDEVPRMLGAAATFTITKVGDDVDVIDVKVVPTVTHISSYSEFFYAKQLSDYTAEEEAGHRMRRVKGSSFSIDNLWKLWYSVIDEEQTGSF